MYELWVSIVPSCPMSCSMLSLFCSNGTKFLSGLDSRCAEKFNSVFSSGGSFLAANVLKCDKKHQTVSNTCKIWAKHLVRCQAMYPSTVARMQRSLRSSKMHEPPQHTTWPNSRRIHLIYNPASENRCYVLRVCNLRIL